MSLPYPEIVRSWITDVYGPAELRAASESRLLQEAIAELVCRAHNVTVFDDKLNVLYHVEDLIQELDD